LSSISRSGVYSTKITFLTGTTTGGFLIPRDIVICARKIDKNKPGYGEEDKAWFLRKINKLTIEKDLRRTISIPITKKVAEETGILERISNGIKKIKKTIQMD